MPTQFGPTSPSDLNILSQFSITGSASAGTQFTGTLYPNGFQNAAQATYLVPAGRALHIGDVSISATPSVDAQLIFKINGVTQGENFLLSQIVSGNSARVKPTQSLVLNPGDVLEVDIITIEANGSTATVVQNLSVLGVLLPVVTQA